MERATPHSALPAPPSTSRLPPDHGEHYAKFCALAERASKHGIEISRAELPTGYEYEVRMPCGSRHVRGWLRDVQVLVDQAARRAGRAAGSSTPEREAR
ncbi:hypothetical protein HDA32_002001 [Spinactinospora alkalitolerans]|uniref:Uncharacterized protein n=1 Tax=Spinactinospora alkalitolerans TaxID=687207 RepID=A0A852TTA1_9ACTN|nr:hypothetical protein [Spinactinospora alkalitolerans]NYE46881.1 hypothetical protein [Spinactinospora alkalitolerans]